VAYEGQTWLPCKPGRNTAMFFFALALPFVFLVLADQY